MQAVHVLMITHDDSVWQHWRNIDAEKWLIARGNGLADLARWRVQGRKLVVLDTALPKIVGWSDPSWAETWQNMQVLVASSRPSDDEARQVLANGASGYLHIYSPLTAIGRILMNVAAGDIWLGRSLVTRMLSDINRRLPPTSAWYQHLTAREKEVAERAAMGHANQAIADALGISERTVRAHLSAVFEKLGVGDRLLLALRVHGIT
ncbi:MAG TPA: response regulator transcription factor [Candidimonas sp.]|nr:response regulator transcription factor [Candidimonas sp.]